MRNIIDSNVARTVLDGEHPIQGMTLVINGETVTLRHGDVEILVNGNENSEAEINLNGGDIVAAVDGSWTVEIGDYVADAEPIDEPDEDDALVPPPEEGGEGVHVDDDPWFYDPDAEIERQRQQQEADEAARREAEEAARREAERQQPQPDPQPAPAPQPDPQPAPAPQPDPQPAPAPVRPAPRQRNLRGCLLPLLALLLALLVLLCAGGTLAGAVAWWSSRTPAPAPVVVTPVPVTPPAPPAPVAEPDGGVAPNGHMLCANGANDGSVTNTIEYRGDGSGHVHTYVHVVDDTYVEVIFWGVTTDATTDECRYNGAPVNQKCFNGMVPLTERKADASCPRRKALKLETF